MSLYNMIAGVNPYALILLRVLKLGPDDIPRFRDTYWNGEHIIVLTRTGGYNREDYKPQNQALTQHPCYVKNEDDEFDSTFALFHFDMPKSFEWVKPKLIPETRSLKQRMEEMLARLKTGDKDDPYVKKVMESFKPLIDQMVKHFVNNPGDN